MPLNRKIRRAAAHEARKLARKAGLPTEQPPQTESSAAQFAANRANAQHSSGPKTDTGRHTSSQNHTTHGLARHNGNFLILATEDHHGFEALKASLAAEHQPTTETEAILLNTMAESHWLANRAQTLQNTCIDLATGQVTDAKMFALYLHYQTTHTRAFRKALNDFLKLRAEKRKIQIGFEAQKRKQLEYQMKRQVEQEDLAWQDPTFKADCTRLAMAKLKGDPDYERLKAEFRAKYWPAQEGATAQAAA